MIQLSRYRGLALILAILGSTIVLLDVGLSATVGFTGRFLPDREGPTDEAVYKGVWVRMLPLLLPDLRPEPGTPIGLLFGQSTLGAGIDARMLDEADGLPIRWANLHGWGGSVNRTRDLVEFAFLAGLKPDVVLIGINPYMLLGHNFEEDHRLAARRQGTSFKRWIWTYDNRYIMNHLLRHAMTRVRLGLLEAFDFGFLSLYPMDPSAITPKPREKLTPLTPAQMDERVEIAREVGWADPAAYRPDSSNSRSLVEIVRGCRARGAKVAIILMPEYSKFRRIFPPEAVRCFDEINRLYFPDDPVPIYDLRDRIGDELFFDTDHAGVDAMPPISKMAALCVRDLLSGHPDPKHLSIEAAGSAARP